MHESTKPIIFSVNSRTGTCFGKTKYQSYLALSRNCNIGNNEELK